ncbi:unnamed protein product, partial [Amoebophrya sp. A120]
FFRTLYRPPDSKMALSVSRRVCSSCASLFTATGFLYNFLGASLLFGPQLIFGKVGTADAVRMLVRGREDQDSAPQGGHLAHWVDSWVEELTEPEREKVLRKLAIRGDGDTQ